MSSRSMLLVAVASILALISIEQLPTAMGAVCAAGTVNDGYVSFSGSNALTIYAAKTMNITGKSFTIMLWIRRSRANAEEAMFSYGDTSVAPADNQNLFFSIQKSQSYYARVGFWNDEYKVTILPQDVWLDEPLACVVARLDFSPAALGPFASALQPTTSPSSKTTDYIWHHWAITYDYSSMAIGIYKDSVLVSGATGTLTSQYLGGAQNLNIGGTIGNSQSYRFVGDIDEFRMYSTVLTQATIAIHYSGLWRNQLANCMLWYKFNEVSGNFHYDSCNINNNNLAFWSGTIGMNKTVTANCLPGYWDGFLIQVTTPSVRFGMNATIRVAQADNGGNPMWTYSGMGTTSVSLYVIGTGTALPQGFINLTLTNGYFNFTFTSNKPETVTFNLTDTGATNRSVTIVSPSVTFLPPDLTSVVLFDANFTGLTLSLTPAFGYLYSSYTGGSVADRSPTVGLRATFSHSATVTINDVDYGPLTSGVDMILPLAPAPSVNNITINSTEQFGSYLYSFTVNRRSPDLTNLVLTPTPPFSGTNDTDYPFVPATIGSTSIGTGGQLTQLLVTANFTVGDITATLNGVTFGPFASGTPFDVSSALVDTGSNTLVVTSPQDDSSWSYTMDILCPFTLVCNPAPAAIFGSYCVEQCEYCDIDGIYRRVCLQAMPANCPKVGAPC